MNELKRSIDRVTTKTLEMCLRMCGIEINYLILDKLIDLVELIKEKGDQVSLKDVCELQQEWKGITKNDEKWKSQKSNQ